MTGMENGALVWLGSMPQGFERDLTQGDTGDKGSSSLIPEPYLLKARAQEDQLSGLSLRKRHTMW